MKKTLLLATMAVMMAATVTMHARTLDASAALQRAGEALSADGPARARALAANVSIKPELTVSADGEPAVYLFRQDGEYLIVAGDDCAPAVLGYGQATDGEMAPAMRYWLDEYARQIEYARAHFAPAVAAKVPAADDKAPIDPKVTTTWNQSAPFNNDCPTVSGTRCVTGCVATAMAQVIKYHNYPARGTGRHSYSWNGQTLTFDYETDFDWNSMRDVYTSEATAEQNAAVAKLMYACGVSVNMKYGTGASSATSFAVPSAMIENFGYDKGIRYMVRDYYGLEEWQDIVYDNLKDYGPIQYSGQNADGGHSFVCDGYSKDGYFHINWGWGGMSDGYFLLTALTPGSQGIGGSSSGYNFGQDIIAAVCPPKAGSVVYEQFLGSEDFGVEQQSVALGSRVTVTGGFWNYSAATLSKGSLGLKIQASDGTVTYLQGLSYTALPAGYGCDSFTVLIPATIAAGTYTVTPCFQTSTDELRVIPMPISAVRSLEMKVAGSTATFTAAPTPSITVTEYTLDSPFYIGKDFKITATLKNTTDEEFYGTVALGVIDPSNGSLIGLGVEYPVDMMGGDEETISYISRFVKWSGTPAAGTYNVCFVNSSTGKQLSDMKEINLQAAPTNTTIGATMPVVEDEHAVNSTELKVSTTVSCSAGYFTGDILLVIFPYTYGQLSSLASYSSGPLFINAGESKEVKFNVNFEEAVKGMNYFCAIYSSQGMMAQQDGYFTVATTTGVDDIAVDEAPVAVRYYNLQGVEVSADNAVPGIYVRVRTYEDGHTVTDRYMLR